MGNMRKQAEEKIPTNRNDPVLAISFVLLVVDLKAIC